MSVLLADDHHIVREGLVALLTRSGYEVTGQVADGLAAVEFARRHRPAVAVLDVVMPRLNGLDAAHEISRCSPETRSVVLSMHSEDHYVLEALRHGVKGYVVKTHAFESLVVAIEQVMKGEIYLSPGLSGRVLQTYFSQNKAPGDALTPRERQVLQLVAEGYTTKQIAAMLSISIKTVESHRTRVMQKLDIHDTVGLVHYAIRHGLVHV